LLVVRWDGRHVRQCAFRRRRAWRAVAGPDRSRWTPIEPPDPDRKPPDPIEPPDPDRRRADEIALR